MSDQDQYKTLEEQVLQAYDKLHNQLDNNTTETDAFDLLSSLPNPSTVKDKDKFTLLHYACYNGWYRVTKELIKKLCDPKAENANGSTPLYFACKSGNLELVKYLILKKNCDPNKPNTLGLVPLHNAALGGHISIANYLIEEKQCSATPRDNNGIIPLHLACQSGNLPMVKLFVEAQNCDPVCVTNDRYTQPIHLACQNGHLEVTKYLIEEKHCDPISLSGEGFQTIHLACKSGNLDLIKYLVENRNCRPDCINLSYKYIWWTPLHLACESGHLNVAIYLIEVQKCDPMYKDNDGVTPLHLACRNGYLDIVKYLTEKQKCDPNCRKKNGCTPLHSACQNGHLHVAKYLIEEQHIHPSCKSSYYWTPLHLACDSGHLDIVRYLIHERLCDPSSKNYHGDTPLSLAYKSHHLSIIVYLIKECMCSALDSRIALTDYVVKSHPEITLFLVASSKLVHHPINATVENDSIIHPAFKVFVVGHESVGKSTFIKAIKWHTQDCSYYNWITEQIFPGRDNLLLDKFSPSTGIIPVHVHTTSKHHFILYDFAGRVDYHASHAAFLENITLTQGCLMVIMIDLKKSLQKCVHELLYWKSFIDNQVNTQHSQRIEVVIVASHVDVVKVRGENPDHKITQIIWKAFSGQGDSYNKIVTDCRQKMSNGLKTISTRISTLCSVHKKSLNISIQVHFLKYLLNRYSMNNKVACNFSDIKDLVLSEDNIALRNSGLIPTDNNQLSNHLTTLSDNGELLFLKNKDNINASWIVFEIDFLLSSVNNIIFSHKFVRHDSSKTGVVSLSEIEKLFPNNDPNIIAGLMLHLEICCEIDQYMARLIIKNYSNISDREKYFFFPHLVNTDPPLDNIIKLSQVRCGWHCRQTSDHEISTTRFAQTVIIQLVTRFLISDCEQATSAQRICTVWKTGMQWQNSSGILALVKFVEQHFTVMVEVGSQRENKSECLLYRGKIIETLLYVKDKVLRAVEIKQTLIDPEQYSQQETSEDESMDRKG